MSLSTTFARLRRWSAALPSAAALLPLIAGCVTEPQLAPATPTGHADIVVPLLESKVAGQPPPEESSCTELVESKTCDVACWRRTYESGGHGCLPVFQAPDPNEDPCTDQAEWSRDVAQKTKVSCEYDRGVGDKACAAAHRAAEQQTARDLSVCKRAPVLSWARGVERFVTERLLPRCDRDSKPGDCWPLEAYLAVCDSWPEGACPARERVLSQLVLRGKPTR
jgi:hypothetical protein